MNASLIAAALDALERAIDATPEGSVGYEAAQALWRRAEKLTARIEVEILCAAKDYPDTFGDYGDEG